MNRLQFDNERPFEFIGLGRIGIDLYANEVNCPMEEVRTFSKFIGGSPANITVGAAKLGLKSGFIGKIADDSFGRYIMKYFKEKDIDISGIVYDRSGANTQIAVSEVLSQENSKCIFYRANVADLNLLPTEIDEDYIAATKILLISGTALAASPSREAVFVAIEYAKKHNVCIMMDIDYRPYNWKSKEDTAVYYSLAAEKCDIILGTRDEFDMIEGISDPGNKDDFKTANRLFAKSASVIVVKHGKEGSKGFSKDGSVYDGVIFPTKVFNTFGAGDSYAAAFIYGILNGFDVGTCMKYGAGASSIVISKNACSDAMPTEEELKTFINTNEAIYI